MHIHRRGRRERHDRHSIAAVRHCPGRTRHRRDAHRTQSYPDRPIKLIVPFPPGGPMDTLARLVAHHVSLKFKQPVVVENRGGAGGTIGTAAGVAADPDGYTLLWGSSGTLAIAPALYKTLSFDPKT